VKGIWQEKPEDWPEDVPFVDPNNKQEAGHKPTQDDLTPMLQYLVKKYKVDSTCTLYL